MGELNPNAIGGLASNLNTKEIVGRFIEIEKRRVAPIEKRRDQKNVELESWNAVKVEMEKLHSVVKKLTVGETWDAKKVDVSNPAVLTAKATRKAVPGKHTIAVDEVALAHQITSQGFEQPDMNVGTGKIVIQVGEEKDRAPITVTINDTNNTLDGIRQAINDSGADAEAFVIKTGSAVNPYQLMLTSKLTGEQGRIHIKVEMQGGEVEAPSYKTSYDKTALWKGLSATEPTTAKRGKGASTPITGVIGDYTGLEDKLYTFMASEAGTVNSETGVTISWTDDQGNAGSIQLNKYNYVPGTPVEFADGLSLLMSDGEVISGDSFTVQAKAERSELQWWLSPEQRAAHVEQPSDWSRKATEGGIRLKGLYDGEDDQTVIFRIENSGQVGGPKPLYLHYEFTKTGEAGKINIAAPYLSEPQNPDTLESATAYDFLDKEGLFTMDFKTAGGNPRQLSIGNGLFVEIPPGVLRDGDTANFDLKAKIPESFWWNSKSREEGRDGKVDQKLAWEPYLDEDGNPLGRLNPLDGLLPYGGKKSTSPIKISGEYKEDLANTYTFKVKKDGTVGITRLLEVEWEDQEGLTGTINFGEGYEVGEEIPFSSGLNVGLGKGRLYEGDKFVINTRTPTIQRPQDSIIRLGASDLGGGIEIRRPTNHLDDVIAGLEIDLLSTDEKPVTITVTGDTEKAKNYIKEFVESYNTLNATVTELTKFDQQQNFAGPLLSDRNVHQFYNEIANLTISAVPGLPQSHNMLFSIGLRIDDKGVMTLDENKLNEKITDNFAAVANILRSNGSSENSAITFLGINDKTRPRPSGYKIDIQNEATKGKYITPILPNVIQVDESNNELVVVADGRKSDAIKLRENTYTPQTLAKEIQSKLQNDKKLGKRGIQVVEEQGYLKFLSGMYGSNSSISVEGSGEKETGSLGILFGQATAGTDVEGTIDGNPADSRGQLLLGKVGTDADGLRLISSLSESQFKPGAEASVIVTKGIATQLDERLKKLTSAVNGDVKRVSGDIASQVKNYADQIKKMSVRIDAKKDELQMKFAKLESTLGKLKSQQSYLGQQLSSMKSSGGGGGGGGGGVGGG